MKRQSIIAVSLMFFGGGCDDVGSERNAALIETEDVRVYPTDRQACKRHGKITRIWVPPFELEGLIFTWLSPHQSNTWDLVFSDRDAWIPLMSPEPKPALFYFDHPETAQKMFRADLPEDYVENGKRPFQPKNYTEVDVPAMAPVPQCPDVYRMKIPFDEGIYFLEVSLGETETPYWTYLAAD